MQDDVLSGTEYGILDYGARGYDARIGRFTEPDPLMENHYNETPYAYCANNPINYMDFMGLDSVSAKNKPDEYKPDPANGTLLPEVVVTPAPPKKSLEQIRKEAEREELANFIHAIHQGQRGFVLATFGIAKTINDNPITGTILKAIPIGRIFSVIVSTVSQLDKVGVVDYFKTEKNDKNPSLKEEDKNKETMI